MGAIVNGLVPARLARLRLDLPHLQRLHEGRDPAGGADADLPSIFVFTHDSIGLGEDGPTHQPIEQLALLRAMPNLYVRAPGGRQRDRAGLALRDRADRHARRRSRSAARACRSGTRAACPDDAIERGAYVLRESYEGRARPDPDRHRLRGAHLHRGRRPARGGRDRHARRVRALPGPLRRAGRGLPRRRAAAERARARVGRGRQPPSAGALGRRRRRRDRHDDVRRLRARSPTLYEHFGFTPENVAERGAAVAGATASHAPERSEPMSVGARGRTSGSPRSPRPARASGSTRSSAA